MNVLPSDPVVHISTGDLRGRRLSAVRHFVGIPYAAPPVGDHRFAAPQPVPAWPGVRDASAPGATAPQRLRAVPGLAIEPVFGISRFVPVHGDDVLPVPPLDALKAGAGKDIDLLMGTNAEEMNLYLVPSGVRDKIGRLLAWLVLRKSQPRAWAVLNAYGAGRKRGGRALTDALSDLVFRAPACRFAEEHRGRAHVYELEWRSGAFGGELGAAHAVESPFVFDTLAAASGPDGVLGEDPPQALATRIHRLWIDFARDGSLPWAPFDRETRQVYHLEAGEAVHEPVMPAARFLP